MKKEGISLLKFPLSKVLPKGFEPPSLVPETKILSIELRKQGCKYINLSGYY